MGAAAAMARHALREADTRNADPSKRAANGVLTGPSTAAGVMAELRARLPEKRRKDAVPALELFVGGSPEAMAKMPRQQQDRYFKAALQWIGERFGGASNVVSAVIHRDETTPHMQVLLVPLLDGRLNAKRLVGNRSDMQQMQTDFAERVGALVGLRRGEKASPAKHTTIRAFYGAVERAGSFEDIPPRRPVPTALPEPGLLASKAKREAYERREQERQAALTANAARQREIERLAAVGLAVKGKPARALPDLRAEVRRLKAETKKELADRVVQADQIVDRQRQLFNARQVQLDQLGRAVEDRERRLQLAQARLDEIERAYGVERLRELREDLARDVQELRDEIDQLHRYRRDRYGG
jgi:hypothetical protein